MSFLLNNNADRIDWEKSVNPYVSRVELIREGDENGFGGILSIGLSSGREIFSIGLPHMYDSRTGPTWAYLFDCEGWTLVDAGAMGAQKTLEEGLAILGRDIKEIQRLIVTHGHQDLDGNTFDLLRASGATLWAHPMYFWFLPFEHYQRGLNEEWPLHRVLLEARKKDTQNHGYGSDENNSSEWMKYYTRYREGRWKIAQGEFPTRQITEDGRENDLHSLEFHYTPGHAVDQICISIDGVLFTGDHILPQISPHPTFIQRFPEEDGSITFPGNRDTPESYYGLVRYLRSLGTTLSIGSNVTVLPAHRLYNHKRLHLRNMSRAGEIIRHHIKRLESGLVAISIGYDTVEAIVRKVFPARKLTGGAMFSAMTEVVSHLELLSACGDIDVTEDGIIRATGSHQFDTFVANITGTQILA